MRLIGLAVLLTIGILAAPLSADAQQADKARRLSAGTPTNTDFLRGL